MNPPTNIKYSPNLVLIAVLSGGLTIVISLVYVLLSVTFIVFRFNCDAFSSTPTGAGNFWRIIFSIYGLSNMCDQSLTIEALTQDTTVLTLVAITLAFSVISLVAGISLVSIVQDERQSRYLSWVVCSYVGSCVASLIVDITTASHFGVDHSYIVSLLRSSPDSASFYLLEVIRQGTLWLMVISMKGFVAPAINCIFLVLLIVYFIQYHRSSKNEQHPIHKVGVLNAFDSKKPEETWAHPDVYSTSPFSRPQINSAFIDDSPPRSPLRRPDPPRSDLYSNRSFHRSDSWHRPQNNAPQNNVPQNTRVFSYLEDIQRPAPPKTTQSPSPAVESSSSWRRDPWPQVQGPPVPAPDYSPTQPRRLKSALKPGYM